MKIRFQAGVGKRHGAYESDSITGILVIDDFAPEAQEAYRLYPRIGDAVESEPQEEQKQEQIVVAEEVKVETAEEQPIQQ